MNMQLKQCFSKSKPLLLKKSQKKPDFVCIFFNFPKKPKVFKKARISKSGLKKAKLATLVCIGRLRNVRADISIA